MFYVLAHVNCNKLVRLYPTVPHFHLRFFFISRRKGLSFLDGGSSFILAPHQTRDYKLMIYCQPFLTCECRRWDLCLHPKVPVRTEHNSILKTPAIILLGQPLLSSIRAPPRRYIYTVEWGPPKLFLNVCKSHVLPERALSTQPLNQLVDDVAFDSLLYCITCFGGKRLCPHWAPKTGHSL